MSRAGIDLQLQLLRATLESSLDGIVLIDPETTRVLEYNHRFMELWGIPQQVMASDDGEKVLEHILRQLVDSPSFVRTLDELYENPQRTSQDLIVLKDGRIFERRSMPLLMEGKIRGRVWYFRDQTERLRARELLEDQQNRLVSAGKMAALGQMAGAVAHEINNPLAIIVAAATSLRQQLEGLPEGAEPFQLNLDRIENTAFRIAGIIKGLSAVSRNSEQDPKVAFPLKQAIEDTVALCQDRFKIAGVLLVWSVDGFERCKVLGRPTQLSQVLLNLMNNAFDAVESLEEKWVELRVSHSRSAGLVRIHVIDSGRGIQPEVLEQIMQPFFTTKALGKGTGLGLNISRNIVEEHGGKLFYEEAAGRTCFVVELPVAPQS